MERQGSKLASATRALLLASDEHPEKIAINAGVTHSWLMKLRASEGAKMRPRCDLIERLYEYLSGKELRF